MNLLLIGIQGSGKGTQAKLLEKEFDWKHITTGDLFRDNIKRKTELGMKAQKYTENGELVPDHLVFELVDNALTKAENGFILDGFPRNLEQTEFLFSKFKIDAVILLDLSDEIARKRTISRRICADCKQDYNLLFKKPQKEGICDACGGKLMQRRDDNEEAIDKRIGKFHQETEKAIAYCEEKGILIRINADQKPDKINLDIKKALA